ncbi:DUF445 family protein [Massilia sp. PAMC28688]|uniref:DUF445 domain-containing protein n=1 Tax=Massilia sp. PAMC28688 TaxID=2861283 RepID=UPI001C637D4F|nr:DUF445 domain-containing protein [Massilia sp. PAMC28688]QYF92970.1 DUF445 family protein [Massilia sp. PAMC28688]
MRAIATGLLVLMAVVFVCARLLRERYPFMAFVGAFAEAAMVGAIADWFAVTALFRHPLGLRIPHTAIIPSNKERIGDNLGNFLEHNFMSYEVIHGELARVDFAGSAARWLDQPDNARAVAAQITSAIPALLRMVEDKDAAAFLRDALAGSLKDVRLAPLLSRLLSVLVAGRQHHALLEKLLELIAGALEQHRPYIRQKVHDHSPRWLPKAIDEKFYERLMAGVHSTLDDIKGDDSEWRERFQLATEELIANLATSPEYEAKLRALLDSSLGHPLFRNYVGQVWDDVRARLLADTSAPDSKIAAHVEQALQSFSSALGRNETVQLKLNDWLRTFAAETIVAKREVIVDLVRRVIRSWDAETLSRKFELHVGRDLQYIRINGTIVGGLVGLLLHSVGLLF